MSMNSSDSKPTRIIICGAHSVGKTTLAEAIAKETGFLVVSEIARTIIRDLGLIRDQYDPRSNPEGFKRLQKLILDSQAEVESYHDDKERNYICDRGIDPIVYAWMYLGENDAKELLEQESTKQNIKRYRSSLVFVIKPFPECMKDDSVRLLPEIEELNLFTSMMENLLCDAQIPYILIDVLEVNERVRIVLEELSRRKKHQ